MPIEPDALHPLRSVLTQREFEVLHAVAEQEFTYAQVALSFGLSVHTVREHMTNVRTKLGVASRSGAVAEYWRSYPPPKIGLSSTSSPLL